MNDPILDLDHFKKRLLEMRDELRLASDMAAGSREAVKLDQTSVGRVSRIDAMERQAMANATENRRKGDLARIELALRNIEEGEYGFCAVCGEPIPQARLELTPMTSTCIKHAV